MITVCTHARSSAPLRARRSHQWPANVALVALLFTCWTTGCASPPPQISAATSPAQVVVAAPPVSVSPTSDLSVGAATVVPSYTPIRPSATSTATLVVSSPTPAAGLIATPSNTVTWHTYQNAAYGMSFQYPPCYEPLTPIPPADQTRPALLALTATAWDRNDCPVPYLRVYLSPRDTYTFPSLGVTYAYDAASDTWTERTSLGETPHTPNKFNGDGWTGAIFGTGDADYTYYAVAIPRKEQQVMVEIGFASDDPTIDIQKQRALEQAILDTLRF